VLWNLLSNVRLWVWKKAFKDLLMVMVSPKCANMPKLMKQFIRAWNMCLLSLPRQICKNELLAQKNLINVIKNGTKTCIEAILKPRKLNTLVKIMLVLF